MRAIDLVTLVVADYDEAIAFYVDRLGFALIADEPQDGGKRWVVVRPERGGGAGLLLAQAGDPHQADAVGRQTGGRVAFFLSTDDFTRDYRAFTAQGVRFLEAPRREPYGTVAVFEDLYGNRWDLIEPRQERPASAAEGSGQAPARLPPAPTSVRVASPQQAAPARNTDA